MKTIVRITLQSLEVPDDYALQERNELTEDVIISEHDGYVFLGALKGGQPIFISLDSHLNQITPLMQFIWWASVGWTGFYGVIPQKIRYWLNWFNTVKDIPVSQAHHLLERRSLRVKEVESGQINFANWDPEIFGDPAKLLSVN